MMKKLMPIMLALPFLLLSVISADAGVTDKPVSSAENRGVLNQEIEKVRIPARGVISTQVENANDRVAVKKMLSNSLLI